LELIERNCSYIPVDRPSLLGGCVDEFVLLIRVVDPFGSGVTVLVAGESLCVLVIGCSGTVVRPCVVITRVLDCVLPPIHGFLVVEEAAGLEVTVTVVDDESLVGTCACRVVDETAVVVFIFG